MSDKIKESNKMFDEISTTASQVALETEIVVDMVRVMELTLKDKLPPDIDVIDLGILKVRGVFSGIEVPSSLGFVGKGFFFKDTFQRLRFDSWTRKHFIFAINRLPILFLRIKEKLDEMHGTMSKAIIDGKKITDKIEELYP